MDRRLGVVPRLPSRHTLQVGRTSWIWALGAAVVVHAALLLAWQIGGGSIANKPADVALASAFSPGGLENVRLLVLPRKNGETAILGATEEWTDTPGSATLTLQVAAGAALGRRAPGATGAPSASPRQDESTRSTSLWNHADSTLSLHTSTLPVGRSYSESLNRSEKVGFANQRQTSRRAKTGRKQSVAGLVRARGKGGAILDVGANPPAKRAHMDLIAQLIRKRANGVARRNPEAPRVERGQESADNSERGKGAQWANSEALSSRRQASPFDLGKKSAGGSRGLFAGGTVGRSVANQGGAGLAAKRSSDSNSWNGNTTAERGNPYFYRMYRRLDRELRFPRALAISLEQGEVVLRFRLLADGQVRGLRVDKRSEFREFDNEALRAFRSIGDLGPVPEKLLAGRETLNVVAPYFFRNPLIR